MDAQQFCGEHGKESVTGRITFTTSVVNRFIKTYTHFLPEDLSKEQIKRIRFLMVDLYEKGTNWRYSTQPLPEEKIELSDFILNA